MDVLPENINPAIVEIARKNPVVRQYFELYLAEGLAKEDGTLLTWREVLEMIVVKLGEQYAGALAGWKDAAAKKESEQGRLLLVNEIPAELIVQSKTEVQLSIAKGMLAKLVSPMRRAWKEKGGRDEDFPPIQLTKSFVEQVDALLEGKVDQYIQKVQCPVCANYAWYIEDGVPICAVCEARKSRRSENFKVQQWRMAVVELFQQNEIPNVPKRVAKLIPELDRDYKREDLAVREEELYAELKEIQDKIAASPDFLP